MKLFTKHPNSVGETYFEHMWFALRYASCLCTCTFAALIHAFFPFLFTTWTSKKIEHLNSWVKTRD